MGIPHIVSGELSPEHLTEIADFMAQSKRDLQVRLPSLA